MRKTILGLSIVLVTIFLVGCQTGSFKQTSLKLNVDNVDLYIGDTYEIEAVVENSNNEIIYTIIEGSEFVTLEENVVTALAEGSALIEVTLEII